MTVKRFQWVFIKDNELELRDNGIVKRFNNERLEELLNELHEECQRLEQENAQFDILIKNNQLAYIDLEKENEKLNQFKEDVFNTIDMHLRMLPTARDNEFNEDDGDPSLFSGAIYMLETLKKELDE